MATWVLVVIGCRLQLRNLLGHLDVDYEAWNHPGNWGTTVNNLYLYVYLYLYLYLYLYQYLYLYLHLHLHLYLYMYMDMYITSQGITSLEPWTLETAFIIFFARDQKYAFAKVF